MAASATIGQDIVQAAALLLQGQLVAIPTETVYGLAANGLDAQAVARIFEVKNRPRFNPLILHFAHAGAAFAFCESVPHQAQLLADAFWPGPLTLVLPRSPQVPDIITNGSPFVAVRVPAHPIALELLRQLPFPLAAPSANPSNYVSPTTAHHVAAQLGNLIPYILDGGPATVGVESTIISFATGSPQLLRQGGISQEDIEAIIGPITHQTESNPSPLAPGQLKLHYSPNKSVVLDPGPLWWKNNEGVSITCIAFAEVPEEVLSHPNCQVLNLSPSGNLPEAAQNIFGFLRQADNMPTELIAAYTLPEVGLGRAVNDRLRRAAAKE